VIVRRPAVAGSFYPGHSDQLRQDVVKLLADVGTAVNIAPKALIACGLHLFRLDRRRGLRNTSRQPTDIDTYRADRSGALRCYRRHCASYR
jgi:hypothetical protein